ncbi:MAG: ATP-dependent sacrificial sulfur transferase LarE [Magnetococcales bacterium]|nr:ATP-dependent sacrificial sulfur transferase LarE [Magnetococcales bacterium]MBF0321364.1 ATP-dependent sacrificial sulfur transferase LarE [Magnetococcales bacterium]
MIGDQLDSSGRCGSLLDALRALGSALVAFSGGVDSAFLVAAVKESGIPYLAVTALSPTMPAHDLEDVKNMVQDMGIPHRFVESDTMDDADFVKNTKDRCFFCKSSLFKDLTTLAQREGFAVVLDGSTTDDLNDYRPGMRAKHQFEVISPLLDAGLSKEDVRRLSRERGLKTWNKPASPCLSSRISYGEPIVIESLRLVESAENKLRRMGFGTLRVRKQGETARIELTDAEIPRLLDAALRKRVADELRQTGFKYVVLDLEGFQSGKLNRVISVQASRS